MGLARSIYSKADIYLLDDPLTALDYSLARYVNEHCFQRLLKDKAVIFVTHQLHLLESADEIIVLVDGKSIGHGTYLELLKAGIRFSFSLADETDTERKDSIVSIETSSDSISRKTVFATLVSTENIHADSDNFKKNKVNFTLELNKINTQSKLFSGCQTE